MLFKLAYKNIRKSIKDYAIYFFTLVLGVAIFYVFNAMDSSSVTMTMTQSKNEFMQLLTEVLGALSVFVSIVLGCLIVYASRFLMKRRKKEFGTYMLLGMSKFEISKILLWETCLIGILSLIVGNIIGIIASQFMSLFVASMFEVNMENFVFTFSMSSLIKTMIYFAIIYLSVIMIYTFTISKTKLIELLRANKQNEIIKLKNTWISLALFIASIAILIYAYRYVTVDAMEKLQSASNLIYPIIYGIIGTILFFYSLSGFILRIAQMNKRFYYSNINMFVVRQLHSKANTTVLSMSIISLMLFIAICVFSSGFALNQAKSEGLRKYAPADASIFVFAHNINQERESIALSMEKTGFDLDASFTQFFEIKRYTSDALLYKYTVPNLIAENKYMEPNADEMIVSVSDYNEIAKMYGNPTYSLNDDEYMVLCNFEDMKKFRDEMLAKGSTFTIDGKIYSPKYKECQDGFISMNVAATNDGVYVLPDAAVKQLNVVSHELVGQYRANDDTGIAATDTNIDLSVNKLNKDGIFFMYDTKTSLYENSVGLSAISTFIGLYLGIIFLITSAAVLALKELSDSTDNKERYTILRKIGVDEKMINHSLATQMAIFFFAPLLLAIVHSYFGVQFASLLLSTIFNGGILTSIFITGFILVFTYGGYFLITYYCSKSIIKEK